MGSRGERIKDRLDKLIDREDIRSTLTLKHVTRSGGSRGGYDQESENVTSTVTINAIPFNHIKNRISFHKFGELSEGELRFYVKIDQTIDTDDIIEFDGGTYNVREIKPIPFNRGTSEPNVVKVITLSKEQ